MKETIIKVKNLLIHYRQNKSQLQELLKAYESLHEQLKYFNSDIQETKDEIIEGMCLQAMKLSDMPRSITNKFNSVTENVALGYDTNKTAQTCDLSVIGKAYIEAKERISAVNDLITLTENMMEILDDRKKFIIKNFYVHGYKMSDITIMHNNTFPVVREHKSLIDMKYEAEREMAVWYCRVKFKV